MAPPIIEGIDNEVLFVVSVLATLLTMLLVHLVYNSNATNRTATEHVFESNISSDPNQSGSFHPTDRADENTSQEQGKKFYLHLHFQLLIAICVHVAWTSKQQQATTASCKLVFSRVCRPKRWRSKKDFRITPNHFKQSQVLVVVYCLCFLLSTNRMLNERRDDTEILPRSIIDFTSRFYVAIPLFSS